jgi:hypothetical protein
MTNLDVLSRVTLDLECARCKILVGVQLEFFRRLLREADTRRINNLDKEGRLRSLSTSRLGARRLLWRVGPKDISLIPRCSNVSSISQCVAVPQRSL